MKHIIIPFFFLSIFAWSCAKRDAIELKNYVYMKKRDAEAYELIFDPGTAEEWTYYRVDSLSISET